MDHLNLEPELLLLGEILAQFQVHNESNCFKPRGLVNNANQCYAHASIQALLACAPVQNLFAALGLYWNQHNGVNVKDSTNFPLIQGLRHFIANFCITAEDHDANNGDATCTVVPHGKHEKRKRQRSRHSTNKNKKAIVDSRLKCDQPFQSSWVGKLLNADGQQEDAEEFLSFLLTGLHAEMSQLMELAGASTTFDGDALSSNDDWGCVTHHIEIGRSPITDIFGGLLRSRIHRSDDQPTDSIQPFFTLQLDTEKSGDVKEALEHLVYKNQVEGLTSSTTNETVEAYEQVTIEELPHVLVLHVKCFNFNENGCTKVMKPLGFPIDLNIEPEMLSSKLMGSKDHNYKLCAVIYHVGKEVTNGHYLTDAYHTGYSCWLRYDDASVKVVPEEYVLKPIGTRVPYLLFYCRSDSINEK